MYFILWIVSLGCFGWCIHVRGQPHATCARCIYLRFPNACQVPEYGSSTLIDESLWMEAATSWFTNMIEVPLPNMYNFIHMIWWTTLNSLYPWLISNSITNNCCPKCFSDVLKGIDKNSSKRLIFFSHPLSTVRRNKRESRSRNQSSGPEKI